MKYKIRSFVTQEIDLDLPHFRKDGEKFFAILNEKTLVVVYDLEKPAINIASPEHSTYNLTEGSVITEFEFMAAYERATAKIATFLQPEEIAA